MLIKKVHLTPLGGVCVYENSGNIVGIYFESEKLPAFENTLKKHFGEITLGESPLLLDACMQIDEYLIGQRIDFSLPLAPHISDFQKKVFDALSGVKYGTTATYTDIAEKIGMPQAVRAVGTALANNPTLLAVPCHRVNARGGMTSGYAGGISIKRRLIALEADRAILNNTEIKSENELQNPILTAYIRESIKLGWNNKELEEYAYKNNIPISKPETLSFIECLLQMKKPQKILEIGAAIGYSALFMKGILPDAQITTIERKEAMCRQASENLSGTGIKLIRDNALPVLEKMDEQFDFIFVDAAKGQYINFYPHVMRLLKSGGVALYDNVLYKGIASGTKTVIHKHRTIAKNLEKFNKTACNDENAAATIMPIGDGLLLSIKK